MEETPFIAHEIPFDILPYLGSYNQNILTCPVLQLCAIYLHKLWVQIFQISM